jgi:hypothetical protein
MHLAIGSIPRVGLAFTIKKKAEIQNITLPSNMHSKVTITITIVIDDVLVSRCQREISTRQLSRQARKLTQKRQ